MENVEERVAKARELHKNGCNCCQAVVMAYADLLPVDAATAMKMASAFGRGMQIRETCGCVSGMAMVCGLTDNTMMFKGLAAQFKEENGEVNCTRLLQTQGAGHSCSDLVACAARLLGEAL